MTLTGNSKYVHMPADLVERYNNTVNTITGATLAEVNTENPKKIFLKQ